MHRGALWIRKKLEKAIIEYSKKSGIGIHQLRHYLTDARLLEIIDIYENLPTVTDLRKHPFRFRSRS